MFYQTKNNRCCAVVVTVAMVNTQLILRHPHRTVLTFTYNFTQILFEMAQSRGKKMVELALKRKYQKNGK